LITLAVLFSLAIPARADLSRPLIEKRLQNGLRVVVCPDPAGADVSLLVRYDVGSRDEPTHLDGLAHLVEHVMFMGSRHVPRGKLAEYLEQAGATNVNGATSADATVFHETLPPERLELGLWLESDRMGYMLDRLDEATFRRAQAEVMNEYRDRIVEVPFGGIGPMQAAELFPAWHPYHHLPVGNMQTLGRFIELGDAQAFAATWYGPANAMVVITGKADPAAAIALVERYFGSLPARTPPQRPILPDLTRTATTQLDVGAGVTRAEVRIAWVTPAYGAPGDAALDLAANILAGRGAGWLQRLLDGPPRLAVAVSAAQNSRALASVFEIRATVADGRSPMEALDAIQRALGRFQYGVSDDELRQARLIGFNARLFGLESSLAWANAIVLQARLGPLPARFDGLLARHMAIPGDAVRAAVRTYLAKRPAVIAVGRPTRGQPTAGMLLGTKEVAP
jgi:predicted Zn-dependent peptidase